MQSSTQHPGPTCCSSPSLDGWWLAGNVMSQALQQAFAPISVGVPGATALIFARASNADWRADLLKFQAALIVLKSRLNPVLLIGIGAIPGIARSI
jgi:chromate transporter